VWTDGACENNGKPSARAGVGVYLGEGDPRNVSEPLEGEQTNNRAELTAVIRALEIIGRDTSAIVYTDSQYVVNGLSSWIAGWKKKGWRKGDGKPVKNRDLWMDLDAKRTARPLVTFKWVRGHAGCKGNMAADRLAVAGIWRRLMVHKAETRS
jgi:ribonuclease HI